jgi:hypothetical protein
VLCLALFMVHSTPYSVQSTELPALINDHHHLFISLTQNREAMAVINLSIHPRSNILAVMVITTEYGVL